MDEEKRLAVCAELRDIFRIWSGLEQDMNDHYIGKVFRSTAIRERILTQILDR